MSVFFIFLSIVLLILVSLSIKLSIKTAIELSILRKSLSDNGLKTDKKPKKTASVVDTAKPVTDFDFKLLTTPKTVNYSSGQKTLAVGDKFTEIEDGVFEL